jgi:cytochrome bd-type quinol oxidase subunit 2
MHKYTIYTLTLLGTLFSGYLSGVKFFTNTCALGETCPLFLGYPACYFGFGMFLALFILANFLVFRKTEQKGVAAAIQWVSVLGIIFAGRFVVNEFTQWSSTGFEWFALGLPTCAYGLIFYMLVLVFVLRYKCSSNTNCCVEINNNTNE